MPAWCECDWGLKACAGQACPRERVARARLAGLPRRGRAGAVAGRGRGARPRRRGETRQEGEGNEGARGRAGARGHMGEGRREGAREGGRRMGGLKPPSAEEPVQSGRRQRQRRRRLQPARRGARLWDPPAVRAPRSLPRSLPGAVDRRARRGARVARGRGEYPRGGPRAAGLPNPGGPTDPRPSCTREE